MNSRVSGIIVMAVLVLLLIIGLANRSQRPTSADEILLEARLERSVFIKTSGSPPAGATPSFVQTIAKVRFIARQNKSVTLNLPVGENAGYKFAFVPKVEHGTLEVAQLKATGKDDWSQEFLNPLQKKSYDNELASGAQVFAAIGNDALLVQTGLSQNNTSIEYKAFLKCVEEVPHGKLNAEGLQHTNNADPKLLKAGVSLEKPKAVPD